MHYKPELDGLRAIAILLVVLFHSRINGVAGGFLGVDVFFVLSGYLITRILAEEHRAKGTIGLLGFYGRRARRLYPALLSMLAVYIAAAPIVFPTISTAAHVRDAFVSALYLSDYAAAFYRIPLRLGHTWSLAIEEHFYLLWPLALLVLLRLPRRWAIAAMFVLAAAATAWRWESLHLFKPWAFTYVRFDTRLSGLLLGGAIGLWQPRVPRPAIAAFVGLAGLAIAVHTQHFRAPAALMQGMLLAELSTVALILGASSVPALSWPAATWIGRMSYGWYLWHYPVIRVVRQLGIRDHGRVFLLGGGASLALAAASFYTIERYFRARRPVPMRGPVDCPAP